MSAPKKEAAGGRCSAEAVVVHSHAHLNALLMRTEKLQQVCGESRSPHSEGGGARNGRQDVCSVVKVKVGGNSPVGEQAARVRAIVDQARAQQQRIRLDANQCWSLPQVHVSRKCPPCPPAPSAVALPLRVPDDDKPRYSDCKASPSLGLKFG
jgi:L-alanine-DL-glutamate epimerase-like enolase superfamily enzyme